MPWATQNHFNSPLLCWSGGRNVQTWFFFWWSEWTGPFNICSLSLSQMKRNGISKKHFFYAKRKRHASLRCNAAKDCLGCQEQKLRRRNSSDHKGEKCDIKIQGQALVFTQEETRTWHSLGSWICEFKASGPTSNSTMHNFLLAGRSGMPEYFLIHLSGLFLLWPPASVLHNSAGRIHRRRVKGSALTAATHAKNVHTWCCEELWILVIRC